MNPFMQTALAEGMAALERVVDAPASPVVGYGTDVSCSFDLDPSTDVSGIVALGQALARRLDCPRGGLVDDPEYGEDIRGRLNRGTTARSSDEIARAVRSELTKDDRVSSVRVTVTQSADGSSMRLAMRVVPIDPAVRAFDLTLSVTSAAVLIEAIGTST